MPLAFTDFNDLVKSTLYDLGRLRFQQIAQSLVEYEIFSSWFKKDKVMFDSGIGIQRTLMNRLSSSARYSNPLEEDSVNIEDVLTQMQVPWVHADVSWGILHQEMLMNRGEARILDEIKARRVAAMINLIEVIEANGWSAPSSSSDTTKPYGVPYWLTKSATTGFNGSYPTGWTTIAGVSLTASPTFKNYTAQYVGVTKADLIKKMRSGQRYIKFVSPVDLEDYRSGKGDRYRIYTNESVFASFEDLGESQNENLGRDLASMDGGSMGFRGYPLRRPQYLDNDTQNPVYMIDHSTFYPVCLKGDYLRESQSMAPRQHNVTQYFVDLTHNFVCVDRRRSAVFATA